MPAQSKLSYTQKLEVFAQYERQLPPPMKWDEFPLQSMTSLREELLEEPGPISRETRLKMPSFHYGIFLSGEEVKQVGRRIQKSRRPDSKEPSEDHSFFLEILIAVQRAVLELRPLTNVTCQVGETVTPDRKARIVSVFATENLERWPTEILVFRAIEAVKSVLKQNGLEREPEAYWYFDFMEYAPSSEDIWYQPYDPEKVLGQVLMGFLGIPIPETSDEDTHSDKESVGSMQLVED